VVASVVVAVEEVVQVVAAIAVIVMMTTTHNSRLMDSSKALHRACPHKRVHLERQPAVTMLLTRTPLMVATRTT
jgi:hypothetical protein